MSCEHKTPSSILKERENCGNYVVRIVCLIYQWKPSSLQKCNNLKTKKNLKTWKTLWHYPLKIFLSSNRKSLLAFSSFLLDKKTILQNVNNLWYIFIFLHFRCFESSTTNFSATSLYSLTYTKFRRVQFLFRCFSSSSLVFCVF